MSLSQMNLCSVTLEQDFGEVVEKVGVFLLRKGFSPLRIISQETSLNLKQVKKAVATLIQHNIVTFERNKKGFVEYSADVDSILIRHRFPRYIYAAKLMIGDAAELIVEEVLHHGQATLSYVIQRATERLNEALDVNDHADQKVTLYDMRDRFIYLVHTQFIQRCPPVAPPTSTTDNMPTFVKMDTQEVFQVPEIDIGALERKRKREAGDDTSQPSKKQKNDDGQSTSQVAGDSTVFWFVNTERFDRYLRDQVMITAVKRRIDERAGEVLQSILRLSETKSDPEAPSTNPVTYNEIFQGLPDNVNISRQGLDQYLRVLVDDSTEFLTKVGESSGGVYQIHFGKAFTSLCKAHLESVLQERFGSKCLRIFRLLILKKQLEQKQIEEFAMITSKEAKDLLYMLFGQHLVSLTEVPKTPDHLPARTFYLFSVNVTQIAQMILHRSYKAIYNAILRRKQEIKENKRLLDKQQKTDAIIASLEQSEQREEIEEMITPAERTQLAKVKHMTRKLETSELALDDTIFTLQTYLRYIHMR